jgi:undecaprenyl-diphosphatase
MDFVEAAIIGFLHGSTELLPLSSSGHLLLLLDFFTIPPAYFRILEAVLFLSSAVAIITYFRNTFWVLIQALLRKLGRLPTNEKDLRRLSGLLIGSVVTIVSSLVVDSLLQVATYSAVMVVGSGLFLASLLLIYAEWRYYINPARSSFSLRSGIHIGLWQTLAVIPGFPRLGVLIAGGMMTGLSRVEAASVGYMLAVPALLALGCKRLILFSATPEQLTWSTIFLAAVISFITALISISIFMRLIKRYTLWPFIWYSLLLTVFVAYTAFFL